MAPLAPRGPIAHELKNRGATLRLLVCTSSRSKVAPEIAEYAESIMEDEPGTFDGIDTEISAVQGATATIIDQHLTWLRAARKAGVRRPPDYSMNLFGLDDGDNIHSDFRREFARRAENEQCDVELVHILNSGFLDRGVLFGFLGAIDLDHDEVKPRGDGGHTMEFTPFADTAAYTAAAALDDRPPEFLFVAGDQLTFHELVTATETGLARKLAVVRRGTMIDMDAEIASRCADEATRMNAVPLMHWRALLSGKGAAGELQNSRYPDIQPQTVRGYARGITNGTADSPYAT